MDMIQSQLLLQPNVPKNKESLNFYEKLYNNRRGENSSWASKDNMKRFASQISELNTQKFNSYLHGGKCNSLVNNDKAFAISSGLQGTPTFVIERNDSSNQENLLGAYTLFQHSKQ